MMTTISTLNYPQSDLQFIPASRPRGFLLLYDLVWLVNEFVKEPYITVL